MENVVALYDELVSRYLFTQAELDLITDINGLSIDTLNDCIYARFGYRSLAQMDGEDDE